MFMHVVILALVHYVSAEGGRSRLMLMKRQARAPKEAGSCCDRCLGGVFYLVCCAGTKRLTQTFEASYPDV